MQLPRRQYMIDIYIYMYILYLHHIYIYSPCVLSVVYADWVILYATYPCIWCLDVFGCGGYGVSPDVRTRGIFFGSSSGSTIWTWTFEEGAWIKQQANTHGFSLTCGEVISTPWWGDPHVRGCSIWGNLKDLQSVLPQVPGGQKQRKNQPGNQQKNEETSWIYCIPSSQDAIVTTRILIF